MSSNWARGGTSYNVKIDDNLRVADDRVEHLVFGAIAVALAFVVTENDALAQAGATGEVVGKQNKDASGVNDLHAPSKASTKTERSEPSRGSSLTMASLRGHWIVKTSCYAGADFLTFDIRETSPSTFAGD